MSHVLRMSTHFLALLLFSAVLAGCGGQSSGPNDPADTPVSTTQAADNQAATVQIRIDNFTFEPRTLTVAVGTKVTWVNRDDVPHTATSTAKPKRFDSGTLDTDGTFSHRFSAPGTYDYFCVVHPKMTGQIIV